MANEDDPVAAAGYKGGIFGEASCGQFLQQAVAILTPGQNIIRSSEQTTLVYLKFEVNKMDELGGEDDPGMAAEEGPTVTEGPPVILSLADQTVLAIQQLSVIVGVALLVGGCFMLMIGAELSLEWAEDRCCKLIGRKKDDEEEDPAALVGSFKRYK